MLGISVGNSYLPADELGDALRGAGNMALFEAGLMVDKMRVARR